MNEQKDQSREGTPGSAPHPRIHNHPAIIECDIIGDVHGCCDELEALMTRLGHGDLLDPDLPAAEPDRLPRLIFVGDIVDRGDRIIDALRLVHRLCVRGHALTVIGNHDYRFERWLRGKNVKMTHGLEETVKEFEALSVEDREMWRAELIEFYATLPWAIRFDLGRAIVAHAAWHAELTHESTEPGYIKAYTMYGPTTGETTRTGAPERIDWAPGYSGPEFVIFGHQVYSEPYWNAHAVGIDTGCVFGGALTGLRYPERETVAVPSRGARYSL